MKNKYLKSKKEVCNFNLYKKEVEEKWIMLIMLIMKNWVYKNEL